MKLLIYSISSPHELTGIGKYNGELTEWFRANGHQVDVLTSLPYYPYWEIYKEYNDDLYKVERSENGTIYSVRLPVSKNVSSLRRILIDLVLMLKTLIRAPLLSMKNRYDIIVLILPPLAIFPVAILSKYFGGSKLHVHIQDFQIEAVREMKLMPSPVLTVLEYIEKLCFYFADLVTSISENMVEHAKDKTLGTSTLTEVFENWADTEVIKPIEEKSYLKKKHGFTEDTFLVVYSGNIGEKQKVDQILPVAKALQNQIEIQILILGEGANKYKLVEKINKLKLNNVTISNLVPKTELNLMLNGSDAQLILQRKESSDSFLPSKYINILSAGVPSVVNANEGTELYKIITKNNTSILVPPEDTLKMKEAILELYKNQNLRKKLSNNSRTFILQKFGKDMVLKRLINNYDKLLSIKN